MTSAAPSASESATNVPVVTMVIPFAGQDTYVDALLDSLPRPGVDDAAILRLELLFVVAPGGRDDLADAWGRRDPRVRIVSSESDLTVDVRRCGLAEARGDWIMFPQADSVFDERFPAALGSFLATAGDVDVIALNARRLVHHSLARRDTHQGRWRFAEGSRVVDLVHSPQYVQVQFESVVVRTAALRDALRWMAPTFGSSDDALAIAGVLAGAQTPRLGLAAEAVVYERIRSHVDRDIARFRTDSEHYLARARLSEALISESAENQDERRWRSFVAIAEAAALLRHEMATPRRATALSDQERAEFVDLFSRALAPGGPAEVDQFEVFSIPPETRAVLRAWAGGTEPQRVRRVRVDPRTSQASVRYGFVGALPKERYLDGHGREHPVEAGKIRKIDYFGQMKLRERVVWVDAAVETVVIDGEPYPLDRAPSPEEGARRRRPRLRSPRAMLRSARRSWLSRAAAVRVLASIPGLWRRFERAWVLMDRADLAGDNAEHLYRWLREHRPETNAWFVLRPDSPDFARLKDEGFRLMPYGSVSHQVMLHHAEEYLSSHAGVDVLRPMGDRLVARRPSWRFTFLQHGVIHNDLSVWLNNQRFDLFVTSSRDEYEGIVGDDTPYVFTGREVALVGMPRYDALRRRADAHPWPARRTILIAPTWRNSLFLPAAKPGERRMPRPDFEQSEYVQSLAALLNDERLRRIAERAGLEIVFLPHPNIGEHFPRHLIPAHVRVTSYAAENVQDLLANARVFLTDYSSLAFDAAFAEAAVVYLQSDDGSIFGGDHTLHPGYFRFDEHGFGPVCRSVDDAVSAVVEAAESIDSTAPYRERARRTFTWWDGGGCERLVALLETPRMSRGV